MKENTILDRILDVYNESMKFNSSIDRAANLDLSNPEELPAYNYSHPEIEGNYLLFFNDVYETWVGKWGKKILKKIAWPIFKRQIYFNATIRQLVYELIVKDRDRLTKDLQNQASIDRIEQQLAQFINVDSLIQIEQKLNVITNLNLREAESASILTNQILSKEEARIASGLWFNDSIIVGYNENNLAYWAGTNERILEKNFILIALARLYESTEIQILDVGSSESLLAYELASLNYDVTAIDIRPIALSHPNLKFVKTDICQPVLATTSFDCVIALSTLEHIGLGWYGDKIGEELDCQAVKQIYALLKPGGSFILTVPYGKSAVTPVHRIYDRTSLQKLVREFTIVRSSYGIQLDDFTYTVTDDESIASTKEHNPSNYLPGAVAMLVCKKL